MRCQFFFILGSHPALSVAEIQAVAGQNEVTRLTLVGHDFSLVEAEKVLGLEALALKLGGVVKTGVVVKTSNREDLARFVYDMIISRYKRDGEGTPSHQKVWSGGKHFFGVSWYGQEGERSWSRSDVIKKLAIEVKRNLRKDGLSVRWVESKEGGTLSSVIVQTNHLLEPRGCEVVLFEQGDKFLVGYTVAVQPFAEYSARDYGRPGRDSRSGMLPPKVARMMINLAQIPAGSTILDPFCGSGTVLQEGLLMGYQVIGSDVNERAVADSRENLEWLRSKYVIRNMKYGVIQCDVRELSKNVDKKADAIVTEPYLGPQQQSGLGDLDRVMRELGALYLDAFKEFARLVKLGGRVVFIFPFFAQKNQVRFLPDPLLKEIRSVGFEVVNLRDDIHKEFANLSSSRILNGLTERGSVLYRRPDQRVGREIFVFKLKTGNA